MFTSPQKQSIKHEVLDFILKQSTQKHRYEHLLKENHIHNNIITSITPKMSNINLIENPSLTNSHLLYKWQTLFNGSQPLSKYNGKTPIYLNNTNNNSAHKPSFKFPCVLIDAPYESFSAYILKGNNYLQEKYNNVPYVKSIHSPRENNEMFYFSKEISDYYVDDFKTFTQRTPILQAKKRCMSAKLQNMVLKVKKQNEKNEKMFMDRNSRINMLKQKSLYISNKDIHHAMNHKKIQPLVEGIYSQRYEKKMNCIKEEKECNEEDEIKDKERKWKRKDGVIKEKDVGIVNKCSSNININIKPIIVTPNNKLFKSNSTKTIHYKYKCQKGLNGKNQTFINKIYFNAS